MVLQSVVHMKRGRNSCVKKKLCFMFLLFVFICSVFFIERIQRNSVYVICYLYNNKANSLYFYTREKSSNLGSILTFSQLAKVSVSVGLSFGNVLYHCMRPVVVKPILIVKTHYFDIVSNPLFIFSGQCYYYSDIVTGWFSCSCSQLWHSVWLPYKTPLFCSIFKKSFYIAW